MAITQSWLRLVVVCVVFTSAAAVLSRRRTCRALLASGAIIAGLYAFAFGHHYLQYPW